MFFFLIWLGKRNGLISIRCKGFIFICLTLSHAAAQGGNISDLIRILDAFTNLINSKDDDGWAPIHYSSWYGHTSVVEELVKRGANVNEQNSNGSTPLHYASGISLNSQHSHFRNWKNWHCQVSIVFQC